MGTKDNNDDIFALRLQNILKEKRMSQIELASLAKCTNKRINAYVTNSNKPPINVVADIARALNISADYLLGLIDEPRPLDSEKDKLGNEIKMIRRSYTSMTDNQRKALLNLVESMVEEE